MQFTETHLPGVYVIDLERHEDDRGWFARAWCREAFALQGLSVDLAQCNLSPCGLLPGSCSNSSGVFRHLAGFGLFS